MPFILRDGTGKISRASTKALVGAEFVPHSHPEVMAFLAERGQDPKQVETAINDLRQTDSEMARTVEDVIMLLLKKNIMKMSELPKIVQERLSNRVKLRIVVEDIYEQASGSKA